MDKVKRLMAAGAPLADAVKIALGERTLLDVAAEREVNRQNLTSALNGSRLPTARDIEAMISEFGGTFGEWREAFADAAAARVRAVSV